MRGRAFLVCLLSGEDREQRRRSGQGRGLDRIKNGAAARGQKCPLAAAPVCFRPAVSLCHSVDLCRVVVVQKFLKARIFSAKFHSEDLCKVQAEDSKDGFCIDDHTVVENINIEITLTGSGYKVLCFSDGRDPDLSLRHHGYHSFKNKCYRFSVFISFISFVISIVNRQNLLVFLLFPGFSVDFLQKRGGVMTEEGIITSVF